jgi:hypothetical protein
MLRKWAHVIMAALMHIALIVSCHHIAGSVYELVRDEMFLTVYDSARELAWAR